MFDMGFFELLLIAIVSLLVIGPERLPETVRSVGLWIGRLKRSLSETRTEIERQIGADDIRRQLHNEQIMRNLEATRREIDDVKSEMNNIMEPERARRMDSKHYDQTEELPDHAHTEEPSANKQEPSANKQEPSANKQDPSADHAEPTQAEQPSKSSTTPSDSGKS
ncbi:Sec-independent protein translocase protein TatB [Gilvimarinus agarilyticus]|uniref:Sec-independent protein translocase protein TatB n=1 Tax=Gilvimarinus agarilyticus TaxID=679259 RepID=UPI0005A2060C|nr:Sec-independent protein translocase protein TatB [Gilvimarinus agarilyticus]